MQKIFNIFLSIVFIVLVLMFGYKTIRTPEMVVAPIDSSEDGTHTNHTHSDVKSYSKEEIIKIVRNYILNNPEDIIKSLEGMHKKKLEESQKQANEYLKTNKNKIEEVGVPPIFGAKENSDIHLVIFYDYNCAFCKKGDEYTKELMNIDPAVQVILRPIPILGEESTYAAKVALAVNKISPAKFFLIHDGLMKMKAIEIEKVKELLAQHEIDYSLVENEINSYSIKQLITENFELAKNLGIKGAPSYIINGTFIPGLIEVSRFTEIIKNIRSQKEQEKTNVPVTAEPVPVTAPIEATPADVEKKTQ